MPQFLPGEGRTARIPVTVSNPNMSCWIELFLGPNDLSPMARSGQIAFTSTGAPQDITVPITMPLSEQTYQVYIDVYGNGILIGSYIATDPVVIQSVAPEGTATLSGRVTDLVSGAPLAGAYMQLVWGEQLDWMENSAIATDPNGYYSFHNIPVQFGKVRVELVLGGKSTDVYTTIHGGVNTYNIQWKYT